MLVPYQKEKIKSESEKTTFAAGNMNLQKWNLKAGDEKDLPVKKWKSKSERRRTAGGVLKIKSEYCEKWK